MNWPVLPNMDYRFGFPMSPVGAEVIEELPADLRDVMLGRLEQATFRALTQLDIDELPEAAREASAG